MPGPRRAVRRAVGTLGAAWPSRPPSPLAPGSPLPRRRELPAPGRTPSPRRARPWRPQPPARPRLGRHWGGATRGRRPAAPRRTPRSPPAGGAQAGRRRERGPGSCREAAQPGGGAGTGRRPRRPEAGPQRAAPSPLHPGQFPHRAPTEILKIYLPPRTFLEFFRVGRDGTYGGFKYICASNVLLFPRSLQGCIPEFSLCSGDFIAQGRFLVGVR